MGNPTLAVVDHDACLQLGGNNEVQALAYLIRECTYGLEGRTPR